jgi:hypothetical protein
VHCGVSAEAAAAAAAKTAADDLPVFELMIQNKHGVT